MDYQESLAYLDELAVFGIKPGLQRIHRLLELLGRPQNCYRTLHVTGTNGKGSVSSMLAEILRTSSIRAGLYISPHLESYTERIQIDGQPVSEQEFADVLETVRDGVQKMLAEGMESPTQFEVLTAMAFLAFAKRKVEYAVIEVGLGGLLDSTNVIVPELSVITNVSMEHADRCGGTLEGIAHHKAGIIKQGVPVVTAAKGKALEIIRSEAVGEAAELFAEGEDFRAECISHDQNSQNMRWKARRPVSFEQPYKLRLLGNYQRENSAVAWMAALLLKERDARITTENIVKAMEQTVWPGRFEHFALAGQEIILDGAHNPAGMEQLRESLDAFFPSKRRVFLLGILRDKEIAAMFGELLRPEDQVVLASPASERAAQPETILGLAKRHARYVEAVDDMKEALHRALALADREALLVVSGSLYLIGGIRSLLQKQ